MEKLCLQNVCDSLSYWSTMIYTRSKQGHFEI